MIKMDYTIFYKTFKDIAKSDEQDVELKLLFQEFYWDLFISAYENTERVISIYKNVPANKKHWLIFSDYGYEIKSYPEGDIFNYETRKEDEFILSYLHKIDLDLSNERICIDITGFLRPYLIYLIRLLVAKKVKKLHIIYSEPIKYLAQEETKFSDEIVEEVRQVAGCGGIVNIDTANDLLIIGSGYEHTLIAKVAEFRNSSRKVQIYGLPSLQADMYQENILRASKASEAVGQMSMKGPDFYYAPANDPFVTAATIQRIVKRHSDFTNLYLSPLSTKAQTLGFCLYYVWECIDSNASIIMPFCHTYSKKTSEGLSRICIYDVELP